MELQRIVKVEPRPGFELRLTYDDGAIIRVEFRSVIKRGGVAAPLEELSFFQRVRVEQCGRVIAWPGEIDFCADALRLKGEVETEGPKDMVNRDDPAVPKKRSSGNKSMADVINVSKKRMKSARFTTKVTNSIDSKPRPKKPKGTARKA